MSFLIDNLVAVVVGTVLLVALVVLQTRQRQVAVDDTVHHVVRGYVNSVMATLTDDVDNMMSATQAEAVFGPGLPFLVDTATAPGMMGSTSVLAFPTKAETAGPGSPLAPALVIYRVTDPDSGPDSVRVGETWRRVFRLDRAVAPPDSVTASKPLAAYSYDPVSPGVIMEFRADLVGDGSVAVRSGPRPDKLHSVRLSIAGGLAKVDSLSGGSVNPRQLNATRLSVTRRPVNL